MKTSILFISILTSLILASCKKEIVVTNYEGQFKTILSDSDMAAVGCFPDNNNVIVVGRCFNNKTPGMILKMDSNGDEIWRKKISSLNRVLWKTIQTNDGFITVGYENDFGAVMNICKYDFEGQLISTGSIPVYHNAISITPADIIQLKNGSYALSCSVNALNFGYIFITDNNFNLMASDSFYAPNTNYDGCFFYGLQQINDSIIGFTASSIMTNGSLLYSNSMLIRTDLNGNRVSQTLLADSVQSETTNCLSQNANGILSVTSGMLGWNNNAGVFVNYFNDLNAQIISGRINLIVYDAAGNFIRREKITSYPGNGLINSTKPTRDGGFIMCGTVNQNNSSTIASDTKIYLLKLDANFNEQWSKVINTVNPSLGVDAFETDKGEFWLTGYQRVFNERFNMIMIKTDSQGNF